MSNDDLSLVPIDDEAAQPLARVEPFDPSVPTVPILCGACRLRFYAPEKFIGLWTLCPDCGKRNEIRRGDPKFKLEVELSEDGGYGVAELDAGTRRPRQMPHLDYSATGDNKPVILPKEEWTVEAPQRMERFLEIADLLSKEEKERLEQAKKRKAEVEAEMYEIRQASRDGVLDKYLAAQKPPDAPAVPTQPASAPDPLSRFERPKPPPLPVKPPGRDGVPSPAPSFPPALAQAARENQRESAVAFFFAPFFAVNNRSRLIVLLVVGFLANLGGEKARSVVYQVVFERGEPGEIIRSMELVVFYCAFLPGAFFTVLWIGLVFHFAISMYLDTADGSRTSEHWLPFDLNAGLSYLLWTLFFLYLAGTPGYFLYFFVLSQPVSGVYDFLFNIGAQAVSLFVSFFFIYPPLFLCVIESDTFLGRWPRKTLGSLRRYPLLWIGFYLLSIPILVGVFGAVFGLAAINVLYEKTWFMQSLFYYPLAAAWLSGVLGILPLIYFRLLGRLAARIQDAWETDSL